MSDSGRPSPQVAFQADVPNEDSEKQISSFRSLRPALAVSPGGEVTENGAEINPEAARDPI